MPGRSGFYLEKSPSSSQLVSMGLKLGVNTITFDVYSGRSQVRVL